MEYESLADKLFDEDNDDIIELKSGDDKVAKFEQIALILYKNAYYAILRPLDLKEDQVVIFRLDDDDEDNLIFETNEDICHKVLEIYQNEGEDEDEGDTTNEK